MRSPTWSSPCLVPEPASPQDPSCRWTAATPVSSEGHDTMTRDAVVDTSGVTRRAASERARVIGAVCAMISVAAPPFLVAVLAVQIEDQLGFSTTQLGVGIGGYFLVSAVLSPSMGRAVGRWGAGR